MSINVKITKLKSSIFILNKISKAFVSDIQNCTTYLYNAFFGTACVWSYLGGGLGWAELIHTNHGLVNNYWDSV